MAVVTALRWLSVGGQLIGIPSVLLGVPSRLPNVFKTSSSSPPSVLEPTSSVEAATVLLEPAAPPLNLFDSAKVEANLRWAEVADCIQGVRRSVANRLGLPQPELKSIAGDYFDEIAAISTYAQSVIEGEGWKEVTTRDGVVVYKKYFPTGQYGHQYPCVKAQGELSACPSTVMELLVDSSRIREYNRYSLGRTDVEHLDADTKVVWNRTQPPLSQKLHDFCTLMHVRELEGGGYMLLTKATEHERAPLLPKHVRSEIMLGVTLMKPHKERLGATAITTVNHIVSHGVPVMIADRVSAKNAIDFILNLEKALLAGG